MLTTSTNASRIAREISSKISERALCPEIEVALAQVATQGNFTMVVVYPSGGADLYPGVAKRMPTDSDDAEAAIRLATHRAVRRMYDGATTVAPGVEIGPDLQNERAAIELPPPTGEETPEPISLPGTR